MSFLYKCIFLVISTVYSLPVPETESSLFGQCKDLREDSSTSTDNRLGTIEKNIEALMQCLKRGQGSLSNPNAWQVEIVDELQKALDILHYKEESAIEHRQRRSDVSAYSATFSNYNSYIPQTMPYQNVRYNYGNAYPYDLGGKNSHLVQVVFPKSDGFEIHGVPTSEYFQQSDDCSDEVSGEFERDSWERDSSYEDDCISYK